MVYIGYNTIMSITTDKLLQKEQRIQELLKALDKCQDKDIVWIVNQLQELGYQFPYPELEDNEYGEFKNL